MPEPRRMLSKTVHRRRLGSTMPARHLRNKMKHSKLLIIVICVFAAIMVLIVAGTLWLASFVMTGERQTLEEAMKWQSERYDTSFYDELEKSDYTVKSSDGYELHVELLKNPSPSDKYVILSHGYTDNRMGSLKYVQMYLDLGYNCIIYDLRGHGENEPTFTTYGIREGQDLAMLVEDTRARYPDASVLGIHGESLGAATTISSLKYDPSVDFAVADCAFADIESVLKDGYRKAGVPTFLVDLADIGARVRYGYSIKAMRPIDALGAGKIPILFVHGEADDLITPENSQKMYDRYSGPKEIKIIPGAGHAYSILTDPEAYKETVKGFLEKYVPVN